MSETKKRCISIIGLGYVGLPLAIAFGRTQKIIGFDTNHKKINELKNGICRTGEVSSTEFNLTDINFTSDFNDLSKADFHIVAVPTPVDKDKKPDLKFLFSASEIIGRILKKDDIVVYESTVYPGTTEDECLPILESESGLKCGKDFFIGYSPERINPGDIDHTFEKITKVVSAQNEDTLDIIFDVYSSVVDAGVHKAPSIKVAEAAKVIENTQRDLNIALINELAILFKKMNIDTHDVLQVASTKWNFLRFYPGLVGGHCISVDPYYLTYKSLSLGYTPEVILAGRNINDSMGKYIADSVIEELRLRNKDLSKIIITILGITFKENVSDIRNTRIIDILQVLKKIPVTTQIYDPHADEVDLKNNYQLDLCKFDDLKRSDVVILAVPHNNFVNHGWILISDLLNTDGGIVYDVKSILNRDKKPKNIDLIRL
jgi:UDP-N-acetyl-D-galactosamine dehydrogenase